MDIESSHPPRTAVPVLKPILLLALSLAVLSPPLYSKITLREVLDRALRLSPAVAAQRLNEEAAALRKVEAEARRVFSLNMGGTLDYASDSPHLQVSDVPLLADKLGEDVPPGLFLVSTPRVMYDLRLNLSLPVYLGGGVQRMIEAEDLGQKAEHEMTRALETKLAAEVKTSFFAGKVLLAKKRSLALLRENLDRHFEKLQRFFEAELVRKTDVLETRLKIKEVDLAARDLDQALAEEKIRFFDLCGLDFEDVEEPGVQETPDLETALAALRTSLPLLRYLDQKQAQTDALRRAAAGQDLPQVSAFAQVHFGRPGISLFNKTPSLYVLGGLNVDFSLLNAKKNSTQAALAGIEGRRIESQKAEALRNTERDLRRLYELKASLEAKASTVDELAALAEEDVRLKTRLYEEGQIPNLDCLAAMSQLEKYRSMKHEIAYQLDAVKDGILTMIGARTEDP